LTRPFQRENPRAKSTRFIQNSTDYRTLLSPEVNEVILFNPQEDILEGLSSNFFGVSQDVLYSAEEGILPGITRAMAMEAAMKLHIEVCLKPVQLKEISQLDEAFLTSASRAILPVKQIDQTVIGGGGTGTVTHRLSEAFQALIEENLEEI
jgi:branched-chain amino acid aminotransferase